MINPEPQTRTVRLSGKLLIKMFTKGNLSHFRVTKGLPPEVEILEINGTPQYVDFVVRGHFDEGYDGNIVDIICTTQPK